jgi:hypothetical protein
MSRIFRITLISILVLFTFACGLISNPLNQAKGLASTAEAIATANPGSLSTLEALPSSMPNVGQYFNPTGKPASNWNNIPIFPQATAGQEYNKDTYGFTTHSSVADVDAFYTDQLKTLGWTSVTNTSNLIIANKDKSVLEMNILPSNTGATVLLILRQQ